MTTEREETIRIVRLLTHRILEQAHAAGGFMELLQGNVHVHEMSDVDRYRLYQQTNDCLRRLTDLAGTLNDLAYYSGVERIERSDRVLINIECVKLAEGQREPVAYRSDIPDYYAVKTNRQCLLKVVGLLTRQAVERTLRHGPGDQPRIFLNVTERAGRGSLTFAVSDRVPLKAGGPPTEAEQAELALCWTLVRLLGGLLYADPHYKEGTRIVFCIAI